MDQTQPEGTPTIPLDQLGVETGPAFSKDPLQEGKSPVRYPWWSQGSPFFLSALFFLSGFLSIFSPLPILFSFVRKGRKWAWLTAFTNSLIVALVAGYLSFTFYFVFGVILALTLAELLHRKKSVEKATLFTLIAMIACTALLWGGYSHFHHFNPIQEVRSQVSSFVDYLAQSVSSTPGLMGTGDLEEWKRSLLTEFPSAIAIFSLIMVWANLVLLLRVNPHGIRESLGLDASFLKKWRAPEFLVWPVIVTGIFLVVDVGVASDLALNVFKFLMAIYAIQGLSILSYFFDLWNVRGFFRFLGFSLALFLMMPLILSLGFFDLWFDFRAKFRQS